MKKKQMVVLTLSLVVLACGSISCRTLPANCQNSSLNSWITNGLVAYYPFNGNANDVTGNGNHGQIIGNVVAAPDRFGNVSSACHFDGTQACVLVTNMFFNVGQSAYTIAGWFCSDDVTKVDQIVFSSAPAPGFALSLNSNIAKNYICYGIGPASSYWTVVGVHGYKNDYVSQEWYHVALTKSGTNYVVYVNGNIDDARSVPAAKSFNCNVKCLFGSINTSGAEVFKGRLDDFRIYNRALSSNEVAQLYSAVSIKTPHAATAMAGILGGSLSGITLTDRGYGYTKTPRVVISGGGGTGASATAIVRKGVVVAIHITSAGSGYTAPPQILIATTP